MLLSYFFHTFQRSLVLGHLSQGPYLLGNEVKTFKLLENHRRCYNLKGNLP